MGVGDDLTNLSRKAWFDSRLETIRQRVTVFDVLRRNGVTLLQSGDDREEQIPCPFHGKDSKPSARVYPPSDDRPSGGAWCFVCQERWDVFALWKKFGDPDVSFGKIIWEIEQAYGIDAGPAPDVLSESPKQTKAAADTEQFKRKAKLTEDRLIWGREAYRKYPEGLIKFLLHGQAIDKVLWAVQNKRATLEQGTAVLDKLLDWIRIIESAQYSEDPNHAPR